MTVENLKSLQEARPELMPEWNHSKNSETSPEEIYYKSNKTVWWICKNNHEWQAPIEYRSRGYGKCKACKSLHFLRPDLYAQLHHNKNDSLGDDFKITELTLATSPKVVWWIGECHHEWSMNLRARVKSGYNCPYCSGQKVLAGFNDLATTHPNLAKQWSPQNQFKATEVSHGSKRPAIWINECGHSWETTLNHRIKVDDSYCPTCRSITFTCPWIIEVFNQDLNLHIDLTELTKSSDETINWEGECGHIWKQKLSGRAQYKNDCLYCSNQQLLEGFNDLNSTNPELVKEWDFKKNKKLPTKYFAGSQEKVWWICKAKGHSWFALISDRNRGVGCPQCVSSRSKGEIEVYEYVKNLYQDTEYSRRDLLSGKQEIDIYISSLKVGIEYNGDYWHSEEVFTHSKYASAKDYHQSKIDTATDNGILLFYIWESDWLENKTVVKEKLTKLLKEKLQNAGILEIDRIFRKL